MVITVEYLPEKGYRRALVIIAYTAVAGAAVYLFFRVALEPLLPFMLAYIIAAVLRKPIRLLHERTRIPLKLLSGVFVVGVFAAVAAAGCIAAGRAVSELRELLSRLSESSDEILADIFGALDYIADRFPIHSGDRLQNRELIYGAVSDVVRSTLSNLSSRLPSGIMNIVITLPNLLMFAIVAVMASFYISADFAAFNTSIIGVLPSRMKGICSKLRSSLAGTGAQYVKAYLIIIVITFAQLLTGFLVLGLKYSFSLALIIALLDILPVIGVGTVLVPWAGVLLLRGDYYNAVGLMIIFAFITVVRQIVEPRVVGASIGLSPLPTLLAMYTGLTLFGISGMFLLPIAAMLAKAVWVNRNHGET